MGVLGFRSASLLLVAAFVIVSVPVAGAPSNDDLANAQTLNDPPASVDTSTQGATLADGEPVPCGSMDRSVWFQWTASSTQRVSLAGEAVDDARPVLAAYVGDSIGDLTAVACHPAGDGASDWGTANVSFHARDGATYSIQLATESDSEGPVELRFRKAETTVTRSYHGATTGVRSYASEFWLGWDDCTYSTATACDVFVAGATEIDVEVEDDLAERPILATFVFEDASDDFVRAGTVCGRATDLAVPPRAATIDVGVGGAFFRAFALLNEDSAATDCLPDAGAPTSGQIHVHMRGPSEAAAPTHDDFADAEPLGDVPAQVSLNNSDATVEPGEPAFCDSMHRSVWYEFTAPETGRVDLEASGPQTDAALAVYRGSSLSDLEAVACGEGSAPQLRLAANADDRFWIQVGATDGDGGDLTLDLSQAPSQVTHPYLLFNGYIKSCGGINDGFGGPCAISVSGAGSIDIQAESEIGKEPLQMFYQFMDPRHERIEFGRICHSVDGLDVPATAQTLEIWLDYGTQNLIYNTYPPDPVPCNSPTLPPTKGQITATIHP